MSDLLYPHEAARVFVRPDESYAWDTANERWLSKYPKIVRECNAYLRFRMTTVTRARYAWVHANDLWVSVFNHDRQTYQQVTRVPEKYWKKPLVPQDRYFVCFLEPITAVQHAMRVRRVANIHGVDAHPWSIRGSHARTEPGKLPDLALTAEAAWLIASNFKLNLAQVADAMNRTMARDRTPRVAQEAAERAIDEFRIPSGMRSFVNSSGTLENRENLNQAGIPDKPAANQ